jgi:hypothetical protein
MLPNISSLNTFGGPLRNYSDVVDPSTDEDAKFRNRYVADVAAMGRTAPVAIVSIYGVNGANPTDPPSGLVHEAMWGNDVGVKPTAVRSGEGIYDITWPTTVNDAMTGEDATIGGGETHTVNFRRAFAQVESADGTFKGASAKVTGPNTVRVYCYLVTTLDDLPGLVITTWVW